MLDGYLYRNKSFHWYILVREGSNSVFIIHICLKMIVLVAIVGGI
jgi:hypothetical protein